MTPEYAKAVDPIFSTMLHLLERIERQELAICSDERQLLLKWINHAEGVLGDTEDWRLAKYALVAWIDAMLTSVPWEGREWWNDNPLEREIFSTRDAYTEFFVKAKGAATLTRKDALEVFYLCVVLGFRGVYNEPNERIRLEKTELWKIPHTIEEWSRAAAGSIQLQQGRPAIYDAPKVGDGAPPLAGRSTFILMSTLAVCCLGALLAYLFWSFR